MKQSQKSCLLVILSVVAGASAYGWHETRRGDRRAQLSAGDVPVEYYVSEKSFSEIENTKAFLAGLSTQFMSTLLDRYLKAALLDDDAASHQASRRAAIEQLTEGLREFKGTDQEFVVLKELLLVLRQAGEFDRWITLYLDALYRQPTNEMIGQFAQDAVKVAKSAGREGDLDEGFRHLADIPFEFESKASIKSVLADKLMAGTTPIHAVKSQL